MSIAEADLTPKERREFDEDLDNLDYFATEIYFDRLLALAADACLRKPLPSVEPTEPSLTRKLVAHSGMVALRTALELQLHTERWIPYKEVDEEENEKKNLIMMTLDTPLRRRDLFHDPRNFTIVKKAEQFGKALIEESFAVLGQDAYKYAEDMGSGDVKKQEKATLWLYRRINKLRSGEEDRPDEGDAYLYHPIRLSPKIIGRYPDMNLEPTCLGASILMASFFEKAGVPYMHAGVQMSAYEAQMEDTIGALEIVGDAMTADDARSPIVEETFRDRAEAIDARLNLDRGYHAAVYAQFADGRWTQIDPYFNGYGTLLDQLNTKMNEIYETLNEFAADAPGLELSMISPLLTIERGMRDAVYDKTVTKLDTEAAERAAAILMNETESVPQKIYERTILPVFERLQQSETTPKNVRFVADLLLDEEVIDEFGGRSFIEDAFYQAFQKYVLWNESPETVGRTMREDPHYYRERLVDLSHLPEIVCAAVALYTTEQNPANDHHHEKVELGLPHARIGFSVLSDFAAYCDDTLPPTFWFAHWPSLVPITESMTRDNNAYQRRSLANMAIWNQQRYLTYTKSHDIVDKFLTAQFAQEEKNGEQDT